VGDGIYEGIEGGASETGRDVVGEGFMGGFVRGGLETEGTLGGVGCFVGGGILGGGIGADNLLGGSFMGGFNVGGVSEGGFLESFFFFSSIFSLSDIFTLFFVFN
jgi:hypothetical protein